MNAAVVIFTKGRATTKYSWISDRLPQLERNACPIDASFVKLIIQPALVESKKEGPLWNFLRTKTSLSFKRMPIP